MKAYFLLVLIINLAFVICRTSHIPPRNGKYFYADMTSNAVGDHMLQVRLGSTNQTMLLSISALQHKIGVVTSACSGKRCGSVHHWDYEKSISRTNQHFIPHSTNHLINDFDENERTIFQVNYEGFSLRDEIYIEYDNKNKSQNITKIVTTLFAISDVNHPKMLDSDGFIGIAPYSTKWFDQSENFMQQLVERNYI